MIAKILVLDLLIAVCLGWRTLSLIEEERPGAAFRRFVPGAISLVMICFLVITQDLGATPNQVLLGKAVTVSLAVTYIIGGALLFVLHAFLRFGEGFEAHLGEG